MYKQCFELLTAQGPKPHKSFSVAQGGPSAEVSKSFDAELKGNIFSLTGQRIQLPPNPSRHQATDFHNTGSASASAATKKVGVTSSLNIVHQFLIFQVFVPSGEPFSIELHVRDKHNTRRRLMFCDGTKSIVTNQMHARIPNTQVRRDCWTNLCIDVNSFIRECFPATSRVNAAPYGTPVTQASQVIQSNRQQNQGPVGGGSGDIVALHKEQQAQALAVGGNNQISKVAGMLQAKNASNNGQNSNSMKTIEVIQLEGTFKIRKIFTSRSQIPADSLDTIPFSQNNAGATALSSGGTMRPEDIVQAAMVGQRIEQIPKNFDFPVHVERFSQVLSYEIVTGFTSEQQHLRTSNSVEESMMVTGLRMTSNTQNSGVNGTTGFHQVDQQNDTAYSIQKNGSFGIGSGQQYQAGYLHPGQIKPSGAGSVHKQSAGAFRVASNERKSSVGGDSNSHYPQGILAGHTLSPNQMLDGSFRLGANLSKQTQNSVVVVDEEANEQQMQTRNDNQTQARSIGANVSRQQHQNPHGSHALKNSAAVSNTTGDTSIFKQANSTASNHGQRSNQTQSTAYSVRTTSSGRQQKKGKFGVPPPHHLQNSQSPINTEGHSAASGAFSHKRSGANHNNNYAVGNSDGRPVYEQVEEMEESASGGVTQQKAAAQSSSKKSFQVVQSPRQIAANIASTTSTPMNNAAQSAKIKRKGVPKTTNFGGAATDTASNDPMTTPKLHQLTEVHQTTIMEENETLRGSMDRHPGSKLGLQNNLAAHGTNSKKFNRVQPIDQRKQNAANQTAAGARKNPPTVPVPGTIGKGGTGNARTKSSVGPKDQSQSTINQQSSQHPLVKGKNAKVSQSSQNLDDSIGGIVGNKIQNNNNAGGRKQQLANNQNNAISPTIARKQNLPKNKLQLSGQRKQRSAAHTSEQPQFQVRGGNGQTNTAGKKMKNQNGATAQFLYNGSGYGSQAQNHLDSDGEQSDFKTTTLRFTNNNFINSEVQRRENYHHNRDSSQGALGGRESNGPQNNSMALLNTLNSQNGQQVAQNIQQNQQQHQNNFRRNSKQFGTSDNFKVTAYNNRDGSNYDQRTDGFSRLNNQSKSPVNLNRQFSTMQGHRMQSDQGYNNAEDEEEEEMIEEDICDQEQSPPLKDKHQTGQKAKALFQGQLQQQQPVPAFRSTESENFNMDAMTTGFAAKMNIKIGATSPYGPASGIGYMKDATPLHDKNSILATKPQIGGTKTKDNSNNYYRNQLVKSPDNNRSFNMGYGQMDSEMRNGGAGAGGGGQGIEEEEIDDDYFKNGGYSNNVTPGRRHGGGNSNMMNIEESQQKEMDPADTCTSDFYQVPIQGGIPVQLTIENGRRPFTPPFAQLIKVGKPPTAQSGSGGGRSQASNRQPAPTKSTNFAHHQQQQACTTSTITSITSPQKSSSGPPPEWIKPAIQVAAKPAAPPKAALSAAAESRKAASTSAAAAGADEVIEEEIEGVNNESSSSPDRRRLQKRNRMGLVAAVGKNTNQSSTTETGGETNKQVTSSEAGSRNAKPDQFHTFAEEPIEFTESYKRREGLPLLESNLNATGTNAAATTAKEEAKISAKAAGLGALAQLHDASGSATQTFGQNRDGAEKGKKATQQQDDEINDDIEREAASNANKNVVPHSKYHQQSSHYLQQDVIDSQLIDQKKQRLLYDKSLKAYYDPETGQYFEMKAQLINQSSLSQLKSAQKD